MRDAICITPKFGPESIKEWNKKKNENELDLNFKDQKLVWLICGATGNVGKSICKIALSRGDYVVAAALDAVPVLNFKNSTDNKSNKHNNMENNLNSEKNLRKDNDLDLVGEKSTTSNINYFITGASNSSSSSNNNNNNNNNENSKMPNNVSSWPPVSNGTILDHRWEDRCLRVSCDFRSKSQIKKLIELITQKFGYLNILVNAYAIGIAGSCEVQNEHDIRTQFEVNYVSWFHLLRAVIPIMRDQNQKMMQNKNKDTEKNQNLKQNQKNQLKSKKKKNLSESEEKIKIVNNISKDPNDLGNSNPSSVTSHFTGGSKFKNSNSNLNLNTIFSNSPCHIIVLGSSCSFQSIPGLGPFCATKCAIEGLTESVAYEVSTFNIKTTIVEFAKVLYDDNDGYNDKDIENDNADSRNYDNILSRSTEDFNTKETNENLDSQHNRKRKFSIIDTNKDDGKYNQDNYNNMNNYNEENVATNYNNEDDKNNHNNHSNVNNYNNDRNDIDYDNVNKSKFKNKNKSINTNIDKKNQPGVLGNFLILPDLPEYKNSPVELGVEFCKSDTTSLTSVTKVADLIWQIAHSEETPLRILAGSQIVSIVNEKLRNVMEEIEDWKFLFDREDSIDLSKE